MRPKQNGHTPEMLSLCEMTRRLIKTRKYEDCKSRLGEAMREFPHSPVPHNLMGIVLEKEGVHMSAMKHFRAAHALDPSYLPARHNLNHYGTFFSKGGCAYDESDCELGIQATEQDIENIGHNDGHSMGRD